MGVDAGDSHFRILQQKFNESWDDYKVRDLFSSIFVSPKILLIIRVIFCVWNFPILIAVGVIGWKGYIPLGVTLTYIHYTIINIWLIFALVLSYYYFRRQKETRDQFGYTRVMDGEVKHLTLSMKIFVVLFEVICPTAFFVSIVYWSLLFPNDPDFQWRTFQEHGINSLIMGTELILNRIWFQPLHIVFFLLFLCCYLALALIYHAVTSDWVYFFLNYDQWEAGLYYPGAFLFATLVYLVVLYVSKWKRKKLNRLHEQPLDDSLMINVSPDSFDAIPEVADL